MKDNYFTIFAVLLFCGSAVAQDCIINPDSTQTIGDFCSLAPGGQSTRLILPEGYSFQLLFKEGMDYLDGSGPVPGRNDFAGYVAMGASSEAGYLSVNHEQINGALSVLAIHYDEMEQLWTLDDSRPVDFSAVSGTSGNCSGGITPWGTILTAEEKYTDQDENGDGYGDLGWLTEVDPVTGEVVNQQKCWALGHLHHENATVLADERTVYLGEDGGSSGVFKFVADQPRDLSSGRLYGLVLDEPLAGSDPTSSTGHWVVIPNGTVAERNATQAVAQQVGVTNFNGVEDVEFHPTTGQIYFAAKGAGRVYRFTDNGTTVSNMETFLGGREYQVETPEGRFTASWGLGNDNLTFDGAGNLWVMQDGGDHYIWVARPDHSQAVPHVDIFARTPLGSEPTGLTFTPDFRFGFFSIQHPNGENEGQWDAAGNEVRFTASATVVFSLAKYLDDRSTGMVNNVQPIPEVSIYPNPTTGTVQMDFGVTDAGAGYELELYDVYGRRLRLQREHLYVTAGGSIHLVNLGDGVIRNQLVFLVIRKGKERIVRKVRIIQ